MQVRTEKTTVGVQTELPISRFADAQTQTDIVEEKKDNSQVEDKLLRKDSVLNTDRVEEQDRVKVEEESEVKRGGGGKVRSSGHWSRGVEVFIQVS